MTTNLIPARVVSPGAIIKKELKARGWDQRDLSDIVGRPYQAINEIIQGHKRVTPETALELAEAFGTSAEFWMNLETSYRLSLARKEEARNQAIARRRHLYNLTPIREISKLGWISVSDELDQLEKRVCEFLDMNDLTAKPAIAASMRHSTALTPETGAEVAWARRVEILASQQTISEYSGEKLLESIPDILACADEALHLEHLPALLAAAGVHLVFVPHLQKTYLDGAAFVLERPNPIVALTLRYNRVDSFWFTLLHELAHVVLGHQGIYFDDTEKREHYTGNPDESEANAQARKWLIPDGLDDFIAQNKPYFSEERIVQFARQTRRHPGIVLGQLQNLKAVNYSHLRRLLVPVETILSPFIDRP